MNEVAERTVAESQSERSEIVFPADSNAMGNLFGGRLMQYIDLVGAMAASRHARAFTVTASMDHLDFVAPVQVGELLILKASVNRAFRTSHGGWGSGDGGGCAGAAVAACVFGVPDVCGGGSRGEPSWWCRRWFRRRSIRSGGLRMRGEGGRCGRERRSGRRRCGRRLGLGGMCDVCHWLVVTL